MKLKWGKEKIYRLSNKVPTAEKYGDLSWWALFVVMVVMIVIFIIKVKG